ncbi:MAG: putative lantibiotic dehydratase [Amycolatopsis sp.]|uniref:lantibiotic dehydratase n=1 Tax=Amycolatopsis sp. TaxID=37632 RepID=UPI00261C8906|nr:lantibiotic dehydratase [Amycolatopsis sp.]MCU1680040.1 putative lantibiotic dehydratase [Amycolatopsis sp.]
MIPDVGTLASAASRTTVSPVAVVRAAGLPVSAIDDLEAHDTVAALQEAAEHERAAAALAVPLGERLYRLVPELDKPLRQAVVKLRRDVHNGRIPRPTVELPAELALDVARWTDLVRQGAARRTAAGDHFAAESTRAAKAMRAHLGAPAVASGLALASPEFTERLLAAPLDDTPSARSVRSATAYLTRVALKTSPFSSLTTVGVTGFSGLRTRVTSSSRPHALALLLACLRVRRHAGRMTVAALEGLCQVDGRWLATLPIRVVARRTPLRVDEITGCGQYERLLADLPGEPELLADLFPDEPGLARRLAEIGLLQPVLPWSIRSRDDFRELAAWAEERFADLSEFTAATRALADREEIIASDPSPARRTASITQARTAVADAFAALGQPAPPWAAELPLFHEAVAAPLCPELPAPVVDDLAEIGRALVPHIWRNARYDELLRCFVLRHGRGAAGVPVLDFLYAFLTRSDLGRVAGLLPRVDLSVARDPARLHGTGTLATASNAVFFQVVAASAAEVAAGAHTTVVNAVHSGGLGLLGRWAAVANGLDAPLGEWAQNLHPGCRVYQVTPHADWASLQRPALGLPMLHLPGDLRHPETGTGLAGLTLAHDPASDTLQVSDHDGPVAFGYTGAVPQHLLGGIADLVCLLSNPWLTLGRVDRDRLVSDEDSARYLPRLQSGRVVWARARWSFAADEVPRPDRAESPVEFFARLRVWGEGHGLPAEVFVTGVSRAGGRVSKRKPQWLGFDHPFSVWAALGVPDPEVSTLDFVEALPARGGHWVEGSDGERVATEFQGLVRHG